MNYWGIVLAAGKGNRFGPVIPKQFTRIRQKSLVDWSLNIFSNNLFFNKIFVVVPQTKAILIESDFKNNPKFCYLEGGKERIDSLLTALYALENLAQEEDWVVEHDAARPCLLPQDLDQLIESCSTSNVGGLLAYPIVDTIKRSQGSNMVLETVDRENLWHAATPQMFRYGLLKKALEKAKKEAFSITDSASAIENLGYSPLLIPCQRTNFKVTYPEDLALARAILENRGEP